MAANIEKIIKHSSNPEMIESAFAFAKKAYKGKYRLSGEEYITHATRVALMLDEMKLDPITISLGILHDILDDIPEAIRKIELKEIEKKFGKEISALVGKISTLSKVRYSLSIGIRDKKSFGKENTENVRRMFLALSGDLRVILVELFSRLDGLDHLYPLSNEKQKLFALETLQIFVPIANRLGLSEIRRTLEDKAFFQLMPKRFNWLKENIKEEYEQREKYLKRFIPRLKRILKKERINFLDINYRAKSYWSTYRKLVSHDMDLDKIHDLLALRIIAPNIESCYRTLGIVHKHFGPISEEIDDYIAKPKMNGYRSLHTTVFLPAGKITEIQIRTDEMDREAEFGVCAHWSYKEKIDLKKEGDNFGWLNPVRSQGDMEIIQKKQTSNGVKDVSDFWKSFKIDFFPNKIFSFTPKGDVIVLPKNSTVVDFAYAVHSDIGNHCESAKIEGKIVPLNRTLENGDVVEITVNKKKLPSKDWLRFVKTSLAKSNIKRLTDQGDSGFRLPFSRFIKRKLTEISEASKKWCEEKIKLSKDNIGHISIAGQRRMLIHIAKCCNPQRGDKVGAYLAPNRATVLHKLSCSNFKKISEKFPERIVDASWK